MCAYCNIKYVLISFYFIHLHLLLKNLSLIPDLLNRN